MSRSRWMRQVVVTCIVLLCTTSAAASAMTQDTELTVSVLNAAPHVPTLVSPTDGSQVGATPNLTASYADPEGDAGRLRFQVCGTSDCTTVAAGGDATSGLASGTDGSWTVTPPLVDGTYYWRAMAIDQYGGASPWSTARQLVVSTDTTRPTTDPSFVPGSNPGGQHVDGTRIWVNPTASGSFTLRSGAADDVAMQRVDFPNLGTGWTPTSASLTRYAPDPLEVEYSWFPDAVEPGPQSFLAWDTSSNDATGAFEVLLDRDPPAPGTLTPPTGATNALGREVSFTVGVDAKSGTAGHQLHRASAGLLADGTCGAYGPFLPVGPASPPSPWVDEDLADASCYRYQLVVHDHVGNERTVTATEELRVDRRAPSATISSTPLGPVRRDVTLAGTAADVEPPTGIATVTVTWSGPTSGTVCSDPVLDAAGGWSCPWDTSDLADGGYVLTVTAVDGAGNPATAVRYVTVDNGAPRVRLDTVSTGTGHWFDGPARTLWVNPAATGTAKLTVTAEDEGTGVSHVDFPDLGGGWTPTGGGTHTTPAPYEFSYGYSAPVTGAGTRQVVAHDLAGNSASEELLVAIDADGPGGSLTYPDAAGAAPQLTFTAGSDSGSGVASWRIERRHAEQVTADTCASTWTAYAPVGATSPVSPTTDETVQPSRCYQYQLVVADNVGNRSVHGSTAIFRTASRGVVVTPAATPSVVAEGGTTASWTVALSAAPAGPVEVVLDGGPLVTLVPSRIAFTSGDWNRPRAVVASAVDDDVDAVPDVRIVDVRHVVSGSDAAYASLPPAIHPVAVTDDDVAAVVVDVTSAQAVEAGASAVLTVRLATRPIGTVTVAAAVEPTQLADPGPLTFDTSNWNVPRTLAIAALDDPDAEGPHAALASVRATSATDTPYAGWAGSPVPIGITDDDAAELVVDASGAVRLSEADTARAATLRVRLAARPRSDVRVAVSTPGDQARTSSEQLTFTRGNWDTPQPVRVTPVDDTLAERTPHVARVRFVAGSDDAAFAAAGPRVVQLQVTDDDPARLLQRPGDGWTPVDGVLTLREAGEQSATLSIVADGDPSRDIRIEPRLGTSDDVRVVPAAAVIPAGTTRRAVRFTATAVDDDRHEEDREPVRLTWDVSTTDPLYADAAIPATRIAVVDDDRPAPAADPSPSPTGGTSDPAPPTGGPAPPGPEADQPERGDPVTPPTPRGGTEQPPGRVVGDDGVGMRAPRETTRATGVTPSRERRSRSVAARVGRFAREHPVVTTSVAAGTAAAAAAFAKPLLVGGKLLGSLGPAGSPGQLPDGLSQLRRLLRRRKNRALVSRLLRVLLRRRRDDDGAAPSSWAPTGRRDDPWLDLLDPDRNGR